MAGIEITDSFYPEDYTDNYDCTAPDPLCGSRRRVYVDGVWYREGRHGMQYAAHRGCLQLPAEPAHRHATIAALAPP